MSEVSREVANLKERIWCNEFVCLSVTNFDPNYEKLFQNIFLPIISYLPQKNGEMGLFGQFLD